MYEIEETMSGSDQVVKFLRYYAADRPFGDISNETVRVKALLLTTAAARIEALEEALRFYADPFAWKKRNDPEDVIRIPDFYSEVCFGDTAKAALPGET